MIVLDSALRREDIGQLCDIDRFNFNSEPTANAIELAERRPGMYHVLRRGDEVLGYTLVMPLRKITFDALKQGKIWEDELTVADVSNSPGGLYICSVAASQRVKNRAPFVSGTLVGLVGGQVGRASTEVIAVPVTRVGEKIARMLRMVPVESELNVPGVDGYVPSMYVKPPLNVGN